MTVQQVSMPPEVQGAIAAYLAARVDNATWDRYIDSLGPGVALDVATTLCRSTVADACAYDWMQVTAFECDPTEEEGPPEPYGVTQASAHFMALLGNDAGWAPSRITLERERGPERWLISAWVVLMEGDAWDSAGRVTVAEYRAWQAAAPDGVPLDPWAVAACRAACHAWSPEWARAQVRV